LISNNAGSIYKLAVFCCPIADTRSGPQRVNLPDSGREPFSTDQQGIDGGAEQKRGSKRSGVRQTDR
jgi:hypothetical protein